MKGIVLGEADLRAALAGTLRMVALPAAKAWSKIAAEMMLFVKEAWNDVHPLGVQEDRYSQPGCAGIPGPPPVPYRTVYRADGPTLKVWSGCSDHPYRALQPDADCHCKGDCQYPMVCSDHHLGKGERMFWYPARECPEWAARLFLRIDALCDGVATVTVLHRRDLPPGIVDDAVRHGGAVPAGWPAAAPLQG